MPMRIVKPMYAQISAASVDHSLLVPSRVCLEYLFVFSTMKSTRTSSKNSENRPRGLLGSGTLEPGCSVN